MSTVSETGVEAVGLPFSGDSNRKTGGSSKALASYRQTNGRAPILDPLHLEVTLTFFRFHLGSSQGKQNNIETQIYP